MSEMMKAELMERLYRLDEDADLMFDDDRKFEMIVVGGSALILLNSISRATHDIDAINVPRDLIDLLDKYDINTQAETYINNFPYNFETRLVPIEMETRKIRFYTASLEDIVIAKLCSVRDTDRSDLVEETILRTLNWELLDYLATDEDELKASILNDWRYADFKANYDDYVRRFSPCVN
ncbi:MAG: hypothetical protein II230_07790 [Clostridia bacterium]|nr:hypothetical protein [Clostridia bacterium]